MRRELVERKDEGERLAQDIAELTGGVSRPLEILEAGCGRTWDVDIRDRPVHLTGIDLDSVALQYRVEVVGDLDVAIVGDVRDTNAVGVGKFDFVYSSFVLEHISGAEQAMENFAAWLQVGGILLIRIPDRHSVFGYVTRHTPHKVHVLYHRWLHHVEEAGRPGHGPYRAVYDPIVSLEGVVDFCESRGLKIERVYETNFTSRPGFKWKLVQLAVTAVGLASLGRLRARHSDLTVLMSKPAGSSLVS